MNYSIITNFLIENATTIMTIGVILISIIGLMFAKKWSDLRAEAYKLVIQVQTLANTLEGKQRFALALEALYSYVPAILKPIITKNMLSEFLQKCYEELKDYLDDGAINDSIDKTL